MMAKGRPDIDVLVQNRTRIASCAEENGWLITSENPLVLEKAGRQIIIKFNGAGAPNGAQWLGGDEFADMGAIGYMNLNTIFGEWMTWNNDNKQNNDEDVDE